MHRIELLPSAARELRKAPANVQHRLVRAIDRLAAEPGPPDGHKLLGAEDVWRIRVGDYRILYQVFDEVLLIVIVRMGHRRDVYR
jgi:mRNA interferase RelE/StbE